MSPLDVAATGIVGSVGVSSRQRLNPASASGSAGAVGGEGSSPLDDFLRHAPTASRPRARRAPAAVPVDDEPSFGRISFSAGVGGVLIALQAELPLEAAASASAVPHAFAAYARAHALSHPRPESATERLMRTVPVERGFWRQPVMVDLLPMMV